MSTIDSLAVFVCIALVCLVLLLFFKRNRSETDSLAGFRSTQPISQDMYRASTAREPEVAKTIADFQAELERATSAQECLDIFEEFGDDDEALETFFVSRFSELTEDFDEVDSLLGSFNLSQQNADIVLRLGLKLARDIDDCHTINDHLDDFEATVAPFEVVSRAVQFISTQLELVEYMNEYWDFGAEDAEVLRVIFRRGAELEASDTEPQSA